MSLQKTNFGFGLKVIKMLVNRKKPVCLKISFFEKYHFVMLYFDVCHAQIKANLFKGFQIGSCP